MVFGFGKKKKEEPVETEESEFLAEETDIGEHLFPDELEKFKLKGPFEEAMEKPSGEPPPLPRFSAAAKTAQRKDDDLEMVLARLDAIEARLKVVEEKLKRL
jgi:hypothetical protein